MRLFSRDVISWRVWLRRAPPHVLAVGEKKSSNGTERVVWLREPGPVDLPEGLEAEVEVVGPLEFLSGRVRPVESGLSVSHNLTSYGTLGAVFQRDDGSWSILGSSHVLAPPGCNPGDPILQPGVAHGGRSTQDVIGKLDRWIPLEPEGSVGDAATATLDVRASLLVQGLPLAHWCATEDIDTGLAVSKFGATTSRTSGSIKIVSLDVKMTLPLTGESYLLLDQLASADLVAGPGDSGALVTTRDGGGAVGLLVGSAKSPHLSRYVIITPIETIQSYFGVELAPQRWVPPSP